MATAFYGSNFFGGEFFSESAPVVDGPPIGGKGDNKKDRGKKTIHLPFKPTGILDRPRKEGRKEVEDRVDESRQIQAEIAGKLAYEFTEESSSLEAKRIEDAQASAARRKEIAQMSAAEIEKEIGILLKKKMKDEEDIISLTLLMIAVDED